MKIGGQGRGLGPRVCFGEAIWASPKQSPNLVSFLKEENRSGARKANTAFMHSTHSILQYINFGPSTWVIFFLSAQSSVI